MSTKPNSYISINPYTLDSGYWTNEELRALCETLGLSTSGNKTELIERYKSYYNNDRLQLWHRQKLAKRTIASNFQFLGVAGDPNDENANPAIDPCLLSPLKTPNKPKKAILRQYDLNSPKTPAKKELFKEEKHICFSPYNMVKLIPHRPIKDE